MIMSNDFSMMLHKYLTNYLPNERGYSENTIKTYRYTFVLFLEYLSTVNIKPNKFELKDFDKKLITEFLDYLENTKDSCISTRNNRLATILSFTRFLMYEYPDYINNYSEILDIKIKKGKKATIDYLEVEEVKSIISVTNKQSLKSYRNFMIIFLLYETGARVSELINMRIRDFHISRPYYIKILGKGNKERLVPLSEPVVHEFKNYLESSRLKNKPTDSLLFTNNRHEKLTRAGINHILNKYVSLASDKVITLKQKRVTPHVLRHSKAMHLLQNGVNLVYIRDFLGHTSIQTTEIYARASSKLKQEAIENAFVDIYPQEEAEWDNTSTLEWLKHFI